MNEYLSVLKQYAVFHGRSGRREYWMFVLFSIIIFVIIGIIESGANTNFLGGIYSLAVFLPALGVSIRRMHDIGKSGWWILISLIPIVGWIIFIVLAAKGSQPGENQYGPNPKGQSPVQPAATV